MKAFLVISYAEMRIEDDEGNEVLSASVDNYRLDTNITGLVDLFDKIRAADVVPSTTN